LQTVPVTIGLDVHRRTWNEGVARFLALTPFMRDMLVSYGLPGDRITVRPTWVPDPGEPSPPGSDVLYVGRLDEAKGADRLLDAWAAGGSRRRLVVAGDGPLGERVRADPLVEALGQVPPEEVDRAMGDAAYVVVPSRVFEGYPLVVAEAFARGRPVLTVAGGSVGTIVDDATGWVVEPTVEALAEALRTISDDDVAARSGGARSRYLAQSTPEQGLASLLATYDEVTRG
jgi:glycosyltransferase involved in cell wall biosynthesis